MDYFDLDEILALQEKIPCSAANKQVDLARVTKSGHGIQQLPGQSQLAAHKLEMPIWLARVLFEKDAIILSELPRCFRPSVIQALKSYPDGFPLRDHSHYFFLTAQHLLSFIQDDSLKQIVLKTFRARLPSLINKAYSNFGSQRKSITTSEVMQHLEHSLDETEKRLFKVGAATSLSMQQWLQSDSEIRLIKPVAKTLYAS